VILRLLLAALTALLAACGSLDQRAIDQARGQSTSEHQVLVMLRLAPPHFRPEANYTGSYESRFGREGLQRIAQAVAGEHGLKVVSDWPMPALGVQCFVMELPPRASATQLVEQLSRDPRVESAQGMNEFHVLGHNDPLYPLQPSARLWHLDDMHQVTTGRDITVAEIDTGVEASHPDLRGQISLTENFVDGRPYVAEAHGTAIAGIIAARADNGIGIAGIAPQAKLMALRACWQDNAASPAARCTSFTLAKALQFALDRKTDVINLSLGGPHDRLLERLLDAALGRGVTVVTATDPQSGSNSFPASHPGVLAVAASDGQNLAPGVLLAPGQDIPTTTTGQRWDFVSGSSYAAAHVTGVVALLRQLKPDSDVRQIRAAFTLPQPRTAAQRPQMLDACAIVARMADTCACSCAMARRAASLLR